MRFNRQARAGYKYWPPCGVPVNMQHKFQQFLFMNLGVLQFINRGWTFQLHADFGTHSAHCAACACCCATTGALVGARRKLWSPQLPFFRGVAQCLVRLWIHVLHHPGWLLEEFYDFPRDWVDSDPGVNSRRSLHTWPIRNWPCSSSTMAVACVSWFCL